jgi:hypothetical protein
LDVHAPHEPIHGWKDFLLHLVTITVGLLIAVGIEGCVERHREHSLVREARETMRDEIEHNSGKMDEELANLERQKAAIQKDLDSLTRIIENPTDKTAQGVSISADFSMTSLRDTAWKTAQATGALAFMPYQDAERYADVYATQQSFLDEQNKILEDEAQLLGLMAKTDFGHGDITKEQASEALGRFGIWRGHLSYLALMAKVTSLNDKAFLEGKEGPKEMHEAMGSGGK